MAEKQDTAEVETRLLFDMVDGLQDLDDTPTNSGNSGAEMSSVRRDMELRQMFGGSGLNPNYHSFKEVREHQPCIPASNVAQSLSPQLPVLAALYPRMSDAVEGKEVPPQLSVRLKSLLRCIHVQMPFFRLRRQTRVTSDMDRFSARYLPKLYRCFRRLGAIDSMGNIERASVPFVVDTWLSEMVADNGTHGFHLPDFTLTPHEIHTISMSSWRMWSLVNAV